jgi:regulator of sigma E protease
MDFLCYFLAFFIIINVVVIVHEYGHYWVAKKVGVKIEVFSVGMGPEVCGFNDKDGTRWRLSLFPIGGYVMMLGDADASSTTANKEVLANLTEEEKNQTIESKSNWEKIAVAFAGPFANYLYAFVVLFFVGAFAGIPVYEPAVGEVVAKSAAEKGGIISGDRIIAIDGVEVKKYREIIKNILDSKRDKISFLIERSGRRLSLEISPDITKKKGIFGGIKESKQVGIKSVPPTFVQNNNGVIGAVSYAFGECVTVSRELCSALGGLFGGKKSLDDFGGVIRMASTAGDIFKSGNLLLLLLYTVTISLNLGFLNLFPLPVLDGGTIVICFLEQLFKRKIDAKILERIVIVCACLLLFLMLITTVNDILRLELIQTYLTSSSGSSGS